MKTKRNFLFIGVILMFSLLLGSGFLYSKRLTYKQVFLRGGTDIYTSIPYVSKWINSKYYLQSEKNKKGKWNDFLVKVNNGKKKSYVKKKSKSLFKTNKMKNSTVSPDKRWVAFTRDKDMYVKNIKTGQEKRITRDGSDMILNGYASWVYYEEVLGRRSRYRAFWWSPDSKRIVFMRFDNTKVPTFTLVRSRKIHGDLEVTSYPKPGDSNPVVTMGVYNISSNNLLWIDTGKEEDKYIAFPRWNPEGTKLCYQEMNRGQDDIKILNVNLKTGKTNELYREKQKAWVEFFKDIYVLKRDRGFILMSDMSGWKHLYHYDMNGKLINRITSGNWRVRKIEGIDEKNNIIYFTGFNKESMNNHLFKVNIDGGNLKQLSKKAGYHRFMMSPDFKYYIDFYSNISTPKRVELYTVNGKLKRVIGVKKIDKAGNYKLGKAEIFRIPAEGGLMLPAKWILPPNFDKNKKYPVLISIYGGPDAAMVYNTYNRASSYYFAQEGIITLSVDHRGSGHFGKKMNALLHRNLGDWEIKDYISAVKWLRTKGFINSKKIGIRGGSYGGYITCMALTKGADYFTHGIASSSVTDWKFYDSIYTERYMDTPAENPKGYENGSVLKYANKLKGVLYILHGEMDDNVHLQNSIQLLSKLEDLDKDFMFMLYPDGRHGWRGKKRVHSTRQSVKFWFKYLLGKKFDGKIM
jgi:dipeptidyl-peptidase-4